MSDSFNPLLGRVPRGLGTIAPSPQLPWLDEPPPESFQEAPMPEVKDILFNGLLALGTGLDGHPLRALSGLVRSFVFLESEFSGEDVLQELQKPRSCGGTGLRRHNLLALRACEVGRVPAFWAVYQAQGDPYSRLSVLVLLAPMLEGLRSLMVDTQVAPRVLVSAIDRLPALEQAHLEGAPFPQFLLTGPGERVQYPGHPFMRLPILPHMEASPRAKKGKQGRIYQVPTHLEQVRFGTGRGGRRREAPRLRNLERHGLDSKVLLKPVTWLQHLTPELIAEGPKPYLNDILEGALCYPGCGVDISPLRQMQGRIHSFVYLEWAEWDGFLLGLQAKVPGGEGIPGYHLVGWHNFRISELILAEPGERKLSDGTPAGDRCAWAVYEETRFRPGREPNRFSFLFLESEALHGFEHLFWNYRKSPLALVLTQHMGDVQPGKLKRFYGEDGLAAPKWIIRRVPHVVSYGSEFCFLPDGQADDYREVARDLPFESYLGNDLRVIIERTEHGLPWTWDDRF